MVFTLQAKAVQQDGKTTDIITHEFVADSLPHLLDRVSEFLRGCGYPIGYLSDGDEPAVAELTALLPDGSPKN
jgi:hypothetical protein